MLANGLVFIGKPIFGLAEPAEPSQGFRPCNPRVPPDLTVILTCHCFQTIPSHITLIQVIDKANVIKLMEGQTHNLAITNMWQELIEYMMWQD